MPPPDPTAPFSEKAFYLQEFRGRTLGFALPGGALAAAEPLASVLRELAANATRVVLICDDATALEKFVGAPALDGQAAGLPGRVWRALAERPCVGIAVSGALPGAVGGAAVALGLAKLVFLEPQGGLEREGRRISFVDLAELRAGLDDGRAELLGRIRELLEAGFPAVNVCTLEGLADELFTYAGSGTLFTRERYVAVRRLGIDDFDAAADLIARGVEEGYLAPRTPEQVDGILASAYGAFVESVHLAGIGALVPHASGTSAEIASLYALTRFLGEGVGAHIVRFALDEAARLGFQEVFACTTSERVARFFERHGFARVPPEALPDDRWQGYDATRKAHLACLRHLPS